MTPQKNVKSHVFWILENVKYVFSNYDYRYIKLSADILISISLSKLHNVCYRMLDDAAIAIAFLSVRLSVR